MFVIFRFSCQGRYCSPVEFVRDHSAQPTNNPTNEDIQYDVVSVMEVESMPNNKN
jgi:hypothetical protein